MSHSNAFGLYRLDVSVYIQYVDDGAPISAYKALLRACTAVLENDAAAGPAPWEEEAGDVR